MAFSTKVQLIKRAASEQWYVNLPSAVAQAMDFQKGEQVQWAIHDRRTLVLTRPHAALSPLEKKRTKKEGG